MRGQRNMLTRRIKLTPPSSSLTKIYRLGLHQVIPPMIYKVEISTCRSCAKSIKRGWLQLARRGGSSLLATIGALGCLSPPPLRKMRLPERKCCSVRQGGHASKLKAVGGGA